MKKQGNTFPRLRWLVALWLVTYMAQGLASGWVEALELPALQAGGVVSGALFALRAAAAWLQLSEETDTMVHTMTDRGPVRNAGLWERIW